FRPQVNILTRNTFANYGWDAICERLGLVQDVIHSTTEQKAEDKLVEALEEGSVPIIWADVFTLGWEYSEFGPGMWAMQPMVVSDYRIADGYALVADRSTKPHRVDLSLLRE